MTINALQVNQSTVVGGLGTQTFNVVTAGLYTVSFKSFIPYQASGSSNNSSVTTGGSSLQVVINLNGTPELTIGSPSPTQAIMGGSVVLQCAAADIITVVLTSAAAVDNAANAIKTIVNLFQGVGQ
jgi:hypothetical protein